MFSPLLFNIVLEALANPIRHEKERKGMQIWKEEITVFVHRWQDCLHRIYPQNLLKINKQKPPELINDYRKVSEYNVNIQKSIAFLFTSNGQLEFEIKNTTFTLASKQTNKQTKQKKP